MSLKGAGAGILEIDHQDGGKEGMSLEQMRAFLQASEELEFAGGNRKEIYRWVAQTLAGQSCT